MAQFCTSRETMSSPGQNSEPLATKPQVRLPNPQTRDRSTDHELLDLLGAFEDVVGLI
jgi:hypothetical protein